MKKGREPVFDGLPVSWKQQLGSALRDPEVMRLSRWLEVDRNLDLIPPSDRVFRAFQLTPFDHVRVVILGQDPYPTPGNADGLAFSVPRGRRPPATLRNILTVLGRDIPNGDDHPIRESIDDPDFHHSTAWEVVVFGAFALLVAFPESVVWAVAVHRVLSRRDSGVWPPSDE